MVISEKSRQAAWDSRTVGFENVIGAFVDALVCLVVPFSVYFFYVLYELKRLEESALAHAASDAMPLALPGGLFVASVVLLYLANTWFLSPSSRVGGLVLSDRTGIWRALLRSGYFGLISSMFLFASLMYLAGRVSSSPALESFEGVHWLATLSGVLLLLGVLSTLTGGTLAGLGLSSATRLRTSRSQMSRWCFAIVYLLGLLAAFGAITERFHQDFHAGLSLKDAELLMKGWGYTVSAATACMTAGLVLLAIQPIPRALLVASLVGLGTWVLFPGKWMTAWVAGGQIDYSAGNVQSVAAGLYIVVLFLVAAVATVIDEKVDPRNVGKINLIQGFTSDGPLAFRITATFGLILLPVCGWMALDYVFPQGGEANSILWRFAQVIGAVLIPYIFVRLLSVGVIAAMLGLIVGLTVYGLVWVIQYFFTG